MGKISLNEIQTDAPFNWILASDGSGGRPVGFYCERCGEEVKVDLPMSVEKYIKYSRRFINDHKRCQK